MTWYFMTNMIGVCTYFTLMIIITDTILGGNFQFPYSFAPFLTLSRVRLPHSLSLSLSLALRTPFVYISSSTTKRWNALLKGR